MSDMQNRLETLQPYVIGVRFFQGLPVVDVIFKDKWVVPDSEIINKEKGEGEDNYYYFYSQQEGIGIDELLDHAESIINLNIEKEKKNELFKVKINELKVLFQNNSLTKLENMKFVLGSPITTEFNPDEINLDDETEFEPVKGVKDRYSKEKLAEKEESKEEPVLAEVVDLDAQSQGKSVTINNTKVELPPKNKNGKVELEEFQEPKITCKCGPEDICPVCEDEKMGRN
jgi:hypothetical protein